jgi:hypothetical protein
LPILDHENASAFGAGVEQPIHRKLTPAPVTPIEVLSPHPGQQIRLNFRWKLIKLHRPQLLFLKDLHKIVGGKDSPLPVCTISCVVPIIIGS